MENAAEALRLAAWVLIFILALSISMNAFGQARESIDQILIASDREYITSYIDESTKTQRIVGAESIVPTIYRAYKENFKIRFKFLEGKGKPLYYRINGFDSPIPVYAIDLQNENISDDTTKEYIIKRILFGPPSTDETQKESNIKSKISNIIDFVEANSYINSVGGLYEEIKGNSYVEKLGIYIQEEEKGTNTDSLANKTEKRVVTYENP